MMSRVAGAYKRFPRTLEETPHTEHIGAVHWPKGLASNDPNSCAKAHLLTMHIHASVSVPSEQNGNSE